MTATTTPADLDAAAATTATRLAKAWNAADGHDFGAAFTDDADFVDIRGDHHEGRHAISAGHQAIFDTIYKGSTVDYRVESVRPVADGLAVAVMGATLVAPAGPLAGTNRSRLTAVLAEQADGRWLVAAFHNTLLA